MPNIQTELFKGLPEDHSRELLSLGNPIRLPSDRVLFELGDLAEWVYHIVRGRVTLTLPMQVRGKSEDILVEERLPGDTLGWSGLIPPHRFTLKATAPVESELVAFSREALLEYFTEHPSAAFIVTRNVATVIGHRLQVFQAMWTREMQRAIESRFS